MAFDSVKLGINDLKVGIFALIGVIICIGAIFWILDLAGVDLDNPCCVCSKPEQTIVIITKATDRESLGTWVCLPNLKGHNPLPTLDHATPDI